MSTENVIDSDKGIIITRWSGPVTEFMLNSVLKKYHDSYALNDAYEDYYEMLLIDPDSAIELPTAQIQQVMQQAINGNNRCKLAIVALNSLSFGLSRMYETYRNLTPENQKQVRSFKSFDKAIEWLASPIPCKVQASA